MYAFNKRFRQTEWQGIPIRLWLVILAFVVAIGFSALAIISGKYLLSIVLFFISVGVAWYGVVEHKNGDDYRIKRLLKSGSRDVKKGELFDL